MLNAKKAVRLSLILTDIFIGVLILVVVALPFGVSWYVETMHRSGSLAATIMVTCYPCAPFVGIILFLLRKILKRVACDEISSAENVHSLKIISGCCLVIAVITVIAGRYYLPFYIVGGTFLFLALLVFVITAILLTELEKEK